MFHESLHLTVSRESAPSSENLVSGVSSDSGDRASCFFTISTTFCTVFGCACTCPIHKTQTLTCVIATFEEKSTQRPKLTAQMRKREDLKEGKLLLFHPTQTAPKLEVL